MLPHQRGGAHGPIRKGQPGGGPEQKRRMGINVRDGTTRPPRQGFVISRARHLSTPTKTHLSAARTVWERHMVLRRRLSRSRRQVSESQGRNQANALHCKGMFCVIAANLPSGTPYPRKPPPWPTPRRRGLLAPLCVGPRPTGVPARYRRPAERNPRGAGPRTGRCAG